MKGAMKKVHPLNNLWMRILYVGIVYSVCHANICVRNGFSSSFSGSPIEPIMYAMYIRIAYSVRKESRDM